MKLFKLALPLSILAAGAGVFLLLKSGSPEPVPVEVRERVWRVETLRVSPAEVAPQISLFGTVESPRTIEASAPAAAVVEKMFVSEGQHVNRGDVLFQLDERDFLPGIDRLDAQIIQETNRHRANRRLLVQEQRLLTIAQENENRAETLLQKNLGSQAALDEARRNTRSQRLSLTQRQLEIDNHPARLQDLEAQKAQLLTQFERSRLKAPYDAVIVHVSVSEGDMVRNGDRLVSFYDPEDLEVRAQIPSSYESTVLDALANGNELSAVTDRGHQLVLERVAAEASSRGINALFRVDKDQRSLISGQHVNLQLYLPPVTNGVAVPSSALYGNDVIYLLLEGRMKAVKVRRLGLANDKGNTQLLLDSKNIPLGAEVIVTHLPNAIDGLKVSSERMDASL